MLEMRSRDFYGLKRNVSLDSKTYIPLAIGLYNPPAFFRIFIQLSPYWQNLSDPVKRQLLRQSS